MTQTNTVIIKQAEQAKPTDELGATGVYNFWGQIREAYIADLQYPKAASIFKEMLHRDPTFASLDVMFKLLAHTSEFSVVAGGNTDADKRAQAHVESCLADMSHPFDASIENNISAIWYGWEYEEIVYKKRLGENPSSTQDNSNPASSKFDDGLIGWRKFAPRKQSSFYRWELDESGGVRGLWQTVPIGASFKPILRYIPIDKALLFNGRSDAGNPEGFSFLEPVYEAWYFVKNLSILQGIGFERSFVGLPVFRYKKVPSNDDKTLVESTGQALRVGEKSYVAIPDEALGFELATTSNPNAAPLLDTIKYYRTLMLQTTLAQFLTLGQQNVGSRALGRDQSELFLMIADAVLDKFVSTYNRFAIPRLFKYLDFGTLTDYPHLKHTAVQKPNLPELAQYLSSLAAYVTPFLSDPANALPIINELLEAANLPVIPTAVTKNQPTPETGTTDEGDLAHPLARGQKYYQMEFEHALSEFRSAVGANGNGKH